MTSSTILWNDGWQFLLCEPDEKTLDAALADKGWKNVEIPHDWLIYDTRSLYKSGDGWYRKSFDLSETDGHIFVCFDGVYMDSTVFVNGKEVGQWKYGYSSFCFEITDFVKKGTNEITVRVCFRAPNSRWYSGAGIYRNVYLIEKSESYIVNDGIYASVKYENDSWKIYADTEISAVESVIVRHTLLDGEVISARAESEAAKTEKDCAVLCVAEPEIWDTENPYLYTLRTELISADGKVIDEAYNNIGFRTIEYSTDKGFLLNGTPLKLHGVCQHHDLGALGSAVNTAALKRQLEILKSFGVNSIRTSHNMPARELMEMADEMGILIDSEAFDMWEGAKNPFDYARFFPQWYEKDVASWVRRDRNHPSLIMWSIGNEIHDTHASPRGLEVTKMLTEAVHRHDYRNNVGCTVGSNYMLWENAQKCTDYLKLAGYNYAEQIYAEHHEQHPDWFIYGSETASAVRSRGVYHMPLATPILTHDDLQCSDLGNSVVSWGRSQEESWAMDRDCNFCGGQYIWTGFDYIGEPTPYSTKNSYFGIVDTAGLPKASYYFYKSVWTAEPFIKIVPHWDWNEGEKIDIVTYSNVEDVELFLDGKSLGKQHIDLLHGTVLHGQWQAEFKRGVLTAKAYRGNETVAEDRASSFDEAEKIILEPETTEMLADGRDLIFIRISAADKDGTLVANARNRITISVDGAARLAGLDSGDSTDSDSYKGDNKRLFSGCLTAIIQATFESGEIVVTASADGMADESVRLYASPCNKPQGISVCTENVFDGYVQPYDGSVQLRKLELSASAKTLTAEAPSAEITAKFLPENAADKNIRWRCVLDNGVECQTAKVEATDNGTLVTAKGDGCFHVRAMCCNGNENPEIISDLAFSATGLGAATIDPYKMVSASLYNFSSVPLRVIERGAVSGIRERTVIGFDNVDFGSFGSDVLRLHIGNCGEGPIDVEVWLGNPDADGEKIDTVEFAFNSRWDSFAPQDFVLPRRINGICSVAFVVYKHNIFGGFEFVKIDKAREKLSITDNDKLYGDDFTINGSRVENIGNNVVFEFTEMDFSDGVSKITICGKTPNAANTIQIRCTPTQGGNQQTQLIEFGGCDEYTERSFTLDKISGLQNLAFVFLPGSNFSFDWFRFE